MSGNRRNEIIAGSFVLLGLAMLFMITFLIQGTTGLSPLEVRCTYRNVAGLDIGSPVLVQGFRVGRVVEMVPSLDDEGLPTVIVVSNVARTIPIYRDATVNLVQQGFIGDKRLEIDPGTPEAGELEDGQMIESIPPTDIAEVLGNAQGMFADVEVILANIREITSDRERIARVDEVIANIASTTERLEALLAENETQVRETIENVRVASGRAVELTDRAERVLADAESRAGRVGEEVEGLVVEARQTRADLDERVQGLLREAEELMASARGEIESVSRVARETGEEARTLLEELNAGRGTIGRLLVDPQPLEDVQEALAGVQSVLGSKPTGGFHERFPQYDRPAAGADVTE